MKNYKTIINMFFHVIDTGRNERIRYQHNFFTLLLVKKNKQYDIMRSIYHYSDSDNSHSNYIT
jgi:hypothetical protein